MKRKKLTKKEIILKIGDKITLKNLNSKSLLGFISQIHEESADVNFIEPTSDTNFKIHHAEISLTGTNTSNENSLDDIITFAEASSLWNIDPSTLRHRIKSGKLEEGVDYKKSGKVWLITKSAMERLYGVIDI